MVRHSRRDGLTVPVCYLLAVLAGAGVGGCSGSLTVVEETPSGGASGVARPSGDSTRADPPAATGGGSSRAGSGSGGGAGEPPSASAGAPDQVEPVEPQGPGLPKYPGRGFVVHEWGTDTIVVGSDGSLQRGLHHEEEDLPGFVYDRLKAAPGSSLSVSIKMETPVTYFYSDVPRSVTASVAFPQGILTQWYPAVDSFLPQVAAAGAVSPTNVPVGYADPVLDVGFPFATDACRAKFSAVAGGLLDWGTIQVLPRDTDVEASLPEAPLEKFGWSYARAVDANPVQVVGGETERFLFYRGLGDFDLPVKVQAGEARHVALTNGYTEAVGRVFVLNVGADAADFTEHPGGISPGATLDDVAPSLEGAPSLSSYESELSQAVTSALDATGLYHDESEAMVNTWKRQWFRTPGLRVLYLIPQTWTDASIPLKLAPQPDAMVRVMLIRVEVITPEQEKADIAALEQFAADADAAAAHFTVLGRFAEPRLRRALSLSPSAPGEAYLSKIQTASTGVASE